MKHLMLTFTRKITWHAILILLAIGLIFWVLSVGSFNLEKRYMYSTVYFDMWNHLKQFSLAVDKSLIGQEAFNINGLTTTYYLPFPALIRGIQSIFGLGESATLSSLLASLVYLISLSSLYGVVSQWFDIKNSALSNGVYGALILASPIIPILALQTIATEAIIWGCALFFASMVCSLKILMSTTLNPNQMKVFYFSILCGFTLFVRAPYSLAVALLFYSTIGVLVARLYRNRIGSKVIASLIIPVLTFSTFLGGLGLFNYLKWGNPLEFYNLKYYIPAYSPEEYQLFLQYGALNITRVLHNFSYYFIPHLDNFSAITPFFKIGDSNFLSGVGAPINYREPTYPIPLMMPIYFGCILIGIVIFIFKSIGKTKNNFIPASMPVILSAAIPPLIILSHHANALRYSGEFIPLITFFSTYVLVFWVKQVQLSGVPLRNFQLFGFRVGNAVIGLLIILFAVISFYFGVAAAFKQDKIMGRYEVYYPTAPVEINQEYVFGGRPGKMSGTPFLRGGWAESEVGHNWSSQEVALLSIPSPYFLHSANIEIVVNALVAKNHPEQLVEVYVNGDFIQTIALNQAQNNLIKLSNIEIHRHHQSILEVLTNTYTEPGFINIEFRLRNAISPKELGLNGDERKLSIDLVSLTVRSNKNFENYPLGQIRSGEWQIHR